MTDAAEQLRLHVEAIEQLESEKKDIADSIKDRYALAKGEGYDTKALRLVIRRRALERAAREELDGLVETYESNLENA